MFNVHHSEPQQPVVRVNWSTQIQLLRNMLVNIRKVHPGSRTKLASSDANIVTSHSGKVSTKVIKVKSLSDEVRPNPRLLALSAETRIAELVGSAVGMSPEETAALLCNSFLFDFTRYRRAVLIMPEGDQRARCEEEWKASNTFVWNYQTTMTQLIEPPQIPEKTRWDAYFPSDRAVLTDELSGVLHTAEDAAPRFRFYIDEDGDQFTMRLMATFFADLLGKDSLQSRYITALLQDLLQDNLPFRDVRNRVKFGAVVFMLATCACLMFGTAELLRAQSQRRQWYWIIAAALALALDMIVVESVEALWFRWALPLCVADTLTALKLTLRSVFDKFEETPVAPGDKTLTAQHLAGLGEVPSRGFSMPNYQFISTNIAKKFPKHLASRIVLSYQSEFARTITTQRWPNVSTTAQLLFGGHSWTSGLGFESIGYVLFSNAAMWLGTYCPRCIQQICLAGALSTLIWSITLLVDFTRRDFNVGVSLAAMAAAVILIVSVSYFVPWDSDPDSQATAEPLKQEGSEAESKSDVEEAQPEGPSREGTQYYSFPKQIMVPLSVKSPTMKSFRSMWASDEKEDSPVGTPVAAPATRSVKVSPMPHSPATSPQQQPARRAPQNAPGLTPVKAATPAAEAAVARAASVRDEYYLSSSSEDL
jgi:hypothetical protein